MAYESSIVVGSGLNPSKKLMPLNNVTNERHLRGTSVVILNPEDASAGGTGSVTAISVGYSGVKLPDSPLVGRRAIAIHNNDPAYTMYIGFDANVTPANGWPVGPNACIPMDLNGQVELYGISQASGIAMDIRILEVS